MRSLRWFWNYQMVRSTAQHVLYLLSEWPSCMTLRVLRLAQCRSGATGTRSHTQSSCSMVNRIAILGDTDSHNAVARFTARIYYYVNQCRFVIYCTLSTLGGRYAMIAMGRIHPMIVLCIVGIFLALALGIADAEAQAESGWDWRTDSGPSPNAVTAYDSARGYVVLFGGTEDGTNSQLLRGDTWQWDGHRWIQRSTTGPLPRTGHAMAYDIQRSRVVLFGGASDVLEAGLVSSLAPPMRTFISTLQLLDVLDSVFPPTLQHDGIVGRSSQAGGLPAAQTSVFGLALPEFGVHVTVNREARVSNRVVELLNSRSTASMFAQTGFPAGSKLAKTRDEPGLPDDVPVGLVITSPAPGSVVAPGVPFSVEVQALPGVEPTHVIVIGPGDGLEDQEPPFFGTFTVPAEMVGELSFQAIARDANGKLFKSDAVTVIAQPLSALTDINVNPVVTRLSNHARDIQLAVRGTYEDGITRRLDTSELGATFHSSNVEVATVDANGKVTAVGNGTASVHVTVGGLSASTLIRVTLAPPQPLPCVGDADGDGAVALPDLMSVLENWMSNYTPATGLGDADYNGVVNFADITSVLANLGTACP